MSTQKYSVNQHLIETLLSWVKAGEIAIPEIQRPFVWDASKVRDLMDSLYQGYPIGYLIAWRNPNVKLKDGTLAEGKKILIDGQQRVTALTAAILGQPVVNSNYKRVRIKIAFNPVEDRFEVFNMAIAKNATWIPDIAGLFSGDVDVFDVVEVYCDRNDHADRKFIFKKVEQLRNITKKQIGLIELDSDLEIETVTDIFIRINSKGVVLSQADFAMSKIAASERYGGPVLRKCIDYFCHLAKAPEYHRHIEEADREFVSSEYWPKMIWLKNEKDDLYDPDYTDLLRVAFTSEFSRGKLADLVSLLSGRNFASRTFEEQIAEESFRTLEKGITRFINETNFKRFLMIIRSAGFITSGLVRSQNALNFAYILYLKLKSMDYPPQNIERYVRKWFIMSILTGRYSSGAPETAIDFDIRNITSRPFEEYFEDLERAELSDAFWESGLVQSLNTSVASSPYFNVYLAAQVKGGDKGFLSRDITVTDMVMNRGDVHHIFPKDYLKKFGLPKGQYNQIANYVLMQSEINVRIGNKAPEAYLGDVLKQCDGGALRYGGITDLEQLLDNLAAHSIPEPIFDMNASHYDDFLAERRMLMAKKIRAYYVSL